MASAGGIVDGTDLYGPVFFQAGPFRRVAFLPEVTSRSCSALIRGADDRPWFSGCSPGWTSPLVLGSPGLNDAVMHMLQACVPHRRMLPAAFERAHRRRRGGPRGGAGPCGAEAGPGTAGR